MGGRMWGLLEAQAEALGETEELQQLRAMVERLQTTPGIGLLDPVAPSPNGKAHAPIPPQTRSKLMTAKELAEFLNVKVDRIYELVAHRELKAKRVGRQLRFTQSAIEEFLEQAATSD